MEWAQEIRSRSKGERASHVRSAAIMPGKHTAPSAARSRLIGERPHCAHVTAHEYS